MCVRLVRLPLTTELIAASPIQGGGVLANVDMLKNRIVYFDRGGVRACARVCRVVLHIVRVLPWKLGAVCPSTCTAVTRCVLRVMNLTPVVCPPWCCSCQVPLRDKVVAAAKAGALAAIVGDTTGRCSAGFTQRCVPGSDKTHGTSVHCLGGAVGVSKSCVAS